MWSKVVLVCGCLSWTLATPAGPADFLLPPPPGQLAQFHQQYTTTSTPPQSFQPEPTVSLEPPFYQRVAQWFGFGGSDETQTAAPSEFQQRHGEPSHLDQAVKPKKAACNPCNKVPWTPMIAGQRSLAHSGSELNSYNNGYPVYSSYRPLPPSRQESQLHTDSSNSAKKPHQQKPLSEYRTPFKQQSNVYNSYTNQATKDDHQGYAAIQTQQQLPYIMGRPQFYQPVYQHYPNYNFYKAAANPHIALPTYSPKVASPTRAPYSTGQSITNPDYLAHQPLLPLQYSAKHHMLPIPLPNLSAVPLPPLFSAKPFRPLDSYGQPVHHSPAQYTEFPQPTSTGHPFTAVQLNTTPRQNVEDNFAGRTPTTAYPTISSDVEIIPSISLGEFTSSIEYPVQISKSPLVDVQPGYSQPEYLASPIIVDQYDHSGPSDNYHSASTSNVTFEQPEFDRDGSIKSIQSQLINGRISAPITIFPDQFPQETTINYDFPSSTSTTSKPLLNVIPFNKRDRGTPKDLLDSPIYYMSKSPQRTTTPNPSHLSQLPELEHTPWTPSIQQGILRITSPQPQEPTERPSRSNNFNNLNHFHSNYYPEDAHPDKLPTPVNKKPKQIQIIIPYTTRNRSSLIKEQSPPRSNRFQNFDSSSGWSVQSHNTDQHDSQESKVITSTVTQAPTPDKTTKYLTKILATNLKDLLQKEKSNATAAPENSIDISRLQKNIDDWTEQEFSTPNKASTVSLSQSQAKIIPSEYLTTTPLTPLTETIDDLTTTVEPLLADQAYSSKYDEKFDAQNTISDVADSQADLWTKLMLSISPSTQEKVYVVTPQPWRTLPTVDYARKAGSGFKSPRFLVRPTPGAHSTSSSGEQGFSFPESGKYFAHQHECDS